MQDIDIRRARIENQRAAINKAFHAAWSERQQEFQTYQGRIWGHIGKGFFTLPPDYTLLPSATEAQNEEYECSDNLAALIALKDFLEVNGVQLIVVMYPNARAVSARVFLPEFAAYPDEKELRITKKLLEHDIEVITLLDRAVKQATDYPFMYFYPIDFHPGEGTGEVAAEAIAEHLQRFAVEFTPNLEATDFARYSENNVYTENFTYPAGVDTGPHQAGEIVRIFKTYYRGKPITFDEMSKVLVCGHSFIQTPAYSAFLSSALAGRIRYIPHNWQISSVGPYTTIPRRLLVDREKFVRGKRVCVLVFDNYFSISRTITPVNVRAVDCRLQAIHSRAQVHQFDLGQFVAHPLENNEKLQRFVQATGADKKQYPLFQITQPDASIHLKTFTIPDKLFVGEQTWLLVEFCLSNKQMVEITVGNQTVASEFHQIPTWQEIFVKLPSGTQDVDIQFAAQMNEALFVIRKVALYR